MAVGPHTPLLDRVVIPAMRRTTVSTHDEATFSASGGYEQVETGPMRVNFAIPQSYQRVPGREPRSPVRREHTPEFNRIQAKSYQPSAKLARNAGGQDKRRGHDGRPMMGAYSARTVYEAPQTTSYSNTVRAPNHIYNILG